MTILILINIIVIIYIYLKYYKFSGNINSTNEELDNIDAITIGYINDKGFNNNFDLILAEIVELNIKGHIIIKYDKKGIDKYNYTIKQNIDVSANKLNKYEVIIMNFLFFNNNEITKTELEGKLSNTFELYNIQFNEVENIVNKKLIKQGIIDETKQKKLPKIAKRYIKLSILSIILVLILSVFKIIEMSMLYILIYILEKVVSEVLLLKASFYTNKGKNLKYNIDKYKMELENRELLSNKNTMENIVLDKRFADSIALHINSQAKQAFINNNITKDAIKISKKMIFNIFLGSTIILITALIIIGIVRMIPEGIRFWLYVIIAIICAGIADVTLSKSKKK